MLRLSDDIISIKGIGEKTAQLFYKMNICSVEDLLLNLPKGFICYEEPVCPQAENNGNIIAISAIPIAGSIISKKNGRHHFSLAKVKCTDGTIVSVRFFNMPYIRNVLKPGNPYILRGVISCMNGNFSMLQPQIFDIAKYNDLIGTLLPNYRLTKGLTNHTIHKACKSALNSLVDVNDYMSDRQLDSFNLLPIQDALNKIHMPSTREDFFYAKKRLAFHEFFTFLYFIRKNKEKYSDSLIQEPLLPVADTGRLIEALPYHFTNAQKKAWEQIEEDMTKEVAMNRMIQGDVGSGKTILGLELIRRLASPCIVLSPTTAIRQQWGERFKDLFLDNAEDFSLLFSNDLHQIKLVNSITYQALYTAVDKISAPEDEDIDCSDVDIFAAMREFGIKTVCLDEAHHLKNEWQKALEKFITNFEETIE